MARRLKAEIKQTRPFASLQEEVFLNLLRTTDALARAEVEFLKGVGLTPTQYNALRILRGAGPDGLRCGGIAERMVTHDSDITRLLDRLDRRGLIVRCRERGDRRAITTRITPDGLHLLKTLDGPISATHRRQFGRLGQRALRRLNELLEQARDRET